MEGYAIIRLAERADWIGRAAGWFHEKWGVPLAAYRKSMERSAQEGQAVPQWYLAVRGERIAGGLGVIENDFHDRRDLTPNVCAVYTEEAERCRGIAGALLGTACADMAARGIETLYLVTEHTSFYERYGWEFFCMARGEDGAAMRLYRHRSKGCGNQTGAGRPGGCRGQEKRQL